jgi:hypothetical protein
VLTTGRSVLTKQVARYPHRERVKGARCAGMCSSYRRFLRRGR